MNDKRDMAPMVWGYIKSRETARRMDAYAGEVTGMHPHFSFDSPARARDMDLATTNAYAGPNHLSAGIQHGSWGKLLFHISADKSQQALTPPSYARRGWTATRAQHFE
jgi:alcohol oxidase